MKTIPLLLVVLGLLFMGCVPVVVPPTSDPTAEPVTRGGVALPTDGAVSLDTNWYFVFDGSGSMTEHDCQGDYPDNLSAAKWGTSTFVTKNLPAADGLGLYVFDSHGREERVPIGKNNRQAVLEEIEKIRAGGTTPLNESIVEGVNALRIQEAQQLEYGFFYLVVITDGEADVANGVEYATRFQIPIITIGFCLGNQHELAQASLSYRDAQNPDELLQALEEVKAEAETFSSPN